MLKFQKHNSLYLSMVKRKEQLRNEQERIKGISILVSIILGIWTGLFMAETGVNLFEMLPKKYTLSINDKGEVYQTVNGNTYRCLTGTAITGDKTTHLYTFKDASGHSIISPQYATTVVRAAKDNREWWTLGKMSVSMTPQAMDNALAAGQRALNEE
jgi:2-keto-3-deoxy-6-phosphogluconate aldolase